MAAKYQLMTELYRRESLIVAKSPEAWQAFLTSACRNYKCRFDEQLLIYAQRPEATAVATVENWNRIGRWVKKNSRGIAVFDKKGRRNTLKYYFDLSDTTEGRHGSRPVSIWQMEKQYEQAVMERLSDRFGGGEGGTLAATLMETACSSVGDYFQDYWRQLKRSLEGSLLEKTEDQMVGDIYRQLAANSVAFMLCCRCGLEAEKLFAPDDFISILYFQTPAMLNAVGTITSDLAENILKEISCSIRNVQMDMASQSRTVAEAEHSRYDGGKQPERSKNHERNHLHQTGRLSYTRPHITDRARTSPWQIRLDAPGLPGTAPAGDVSQSFDNRKTQRTSLPDRAGSPAETGDSGKTALQGAGSDGRAEREGSYAVDRHGGQHPQSGGGNDTDRADLQLIHLESETQAKDDCRMEGVPAAQLTGGGEQLGIVTREEIKANLPTVDEQIEMMAEAEDEKSSAFSISQEDIDSVLTRGSGFQYGKYRIYRQFQKNEGSISNIAFLKNEYGMGGGTHYYPDGTRGGEWHDSKGIGIEKHGSYTNPDLRLSWTKIEKRLRELIKDNRYLDPKEKDRYIDFLEGISAPQYEIDIQRKLSRRRFIEAHRETQPADKRDTLSLRLSDFIRDLDGYEKALLENIGRPDFSDMTAEQMEQVFADPAAVQQLIDFLALVQGTTADVYSRSNAWRFSQELTELYPLRYIYHEGDVVYIGADKYEISDFNENAVALRNMEFPLFGKELSRIDFEEKLRENPANGHLKTVITESQKAKAFTGEKPDSITFSISFSEHPAFYDRQLNDRFTDLSFALGNRLLGILDEKQHRERLDKSKGVGWYIKTNFKISAVVGGGDFHYEGRFDIGDGEGDLIAHIKNFYEYSLSPNCPFIPEWKRQGGDYYREQMENLRFGRDVFIPFLEQHTGLTPEDEKLLVEIMATEADWNRRAGDNGSCVSAADYFDTTEKVQEHADTLNRAGHIVKPFAAKEAGGEGRQWKDNSDLTGIEITIDNRRYLIESIGEISGDVSMRDITFQNNVSFPINRVEKIGYIRRLLERAEKELPSEEKAEVLAKPSVPTFSVDCHNCHIADGALSVGGEKEKKHLAMKLPERRAEDRER